MLKNEDLNLIQKYGRLIARDGDQNATDRAAEMLACTVDDKEFHRLHFYLEEGTRNYATDTEHSNRCLQIVRERAIVFYLAELDPMKNNR